MIKKDKKMNRRSKLIAGIIAPLLAIVLCLGVILPSVFVWKENKESVPASTPSVEEGSKWSDRVLAVAETGDVTLDADITGASSADASLKGGAIVLENRATFTMTGGTVSGHERVYGGAIFIGNGATFTMNGGEISGNKAKYGGAIYVANGGHCIINGGKITANKSEVGLAIYVEKGGELKLGENAEIEANIQEPYDQNTPEEPVAPEGYMYFGEYPKTIKASNVTISGNPDAKGYYTGSDGAKYAKVVVGDFVADLQAQGMLANLSDGTALTTGAELYFKVEKILWRILEQKDGTALIVTDNAIDNVIWQPDYTQNGNDYFTTANGAPEGTYANNYKYSNIRKWLNADFYNNAFTDADKAKILTTEVDNSLASTMDTENKYVCENTNDKIFLLSQSDMYNADYGFSTVFESENMSEMQDIKRKFDNTDFAKAKGAVTATQTFVDAAGAENEEYKALFEPYIGSCFFWLRSPYSGVSSHALNCYMGVAVVDMNLDSPIYGVVCSLRVSVSDAPVDLGESISANIYVDGEVDGPFVVNSLTKLKNLKDFDIGDGITLSIIDEQSCGLFLNEELTMSLENYSEMTVGDAIKNLQGMDMSASEKTLNLYTKIATPEKLSFTLTSDDTYEVKALNTSISGIVVVPRMYNGKLVDRFFENDFEFDYDIAFDSQPYDQFQGAFTNCTGVSEIYIPGNIQKIGNFFISNTLMSQSHAFNKINLHDNLRTIGKASFGICFALQEIIIPDSVELIDECAFLSCSNLKTVVLPQALNKLSEGTFGLCTSLENLVIPQTVTFIGNCAFYYSDLSKCTIDVSNVEIFDRKAFCGCEGLTSLVIGEKCTQIGSFAFGESSLSKLYLPSSVQTINVSYYHTIFEQLRNDPPFGSTVQIYTNVVDSSSVPEGWEENWNGGATVHYGSSHESFEAMS